MKVPKGKTVYISGRKYVEGQELPPFSSLDFRIKNAPKKTVIKKQAEPEIEQPVFEKKQKSVKPKKNKYNYNSELYEDSEIIE